jgi:parallel beta-helix repeat protein
LTADRNVISANGANGIIVTGASSNLIEGNYIGTDAGGTLNRANAYNGIR